MVKVLTLHAHSEPYDQPEPKVRAVHQAKPRDEWQSTKDHTLNRACPIYYGSWISIDLVAPL